MLVITSNRGIIPDKVWYIGLLDWPGNWIVPFNSQLADLYQQSPGTLWSKWLEQFTWPSHQNYHLGPWAIRCGIGGGEIDYQYFASIPDDFAFNTLPTDIGKHRWGFRGTLGPGVSGDVSTFVLLEGYMVLILVAAGFTWTKKGPRIQGFRDVCLYHVIYHDQ